MARRVSAEQPWFVRVKSGRRCDLRPASLAGWLITLLYGIAVGAISLYFLERAEPSAVEIAAWAALMSAATFLYLLTAWRTAAVVTREGIGCPAPKATGAEVKRTLLIAVATAAAIIGAALLGIQL